MMGALQPAILSGRNAPARSFALPPTAALLGTTIAVALAAAVASLLEPGVTLAAFWPANALLLAIIVRAAPGKRGAYLLAGFVGELAGAFRPGSAEAAAFACFDTLQVGLAAWLVTWRAGNAYRLWRGATLADVYFWAAGIAPAVGASLVTIVVFHSNGSGAASAWLTWFGRGALGTLGLLPLALLFDVRAMRSLFGRAELLSTLPALAAASIAAELIFAQQAYRALFMVFPVLVAIAFRLGVTGAALSVLVTAAFALANTASGRGPLVLAHPLLHASHLLDVQLFVAIATWTSLPIATLLHERNELTRIMGDNFSALFASHGELAMRNEQIEALISLEAQITAALPSRRAVLEVVLDFAQRRSSASGTTFERVHGDVMVVEMATGALAAAVGATLQRASSLSGICVSSNDVLYSRDAFEDPRVDRELARRLNVRSTICVPIAISGAVNAVLKLSSDRKDAFGDNEVLNLKLIANHLASAMRAADEFEQLELAQAEAAATIEHLSEGVIVFAADRTVVRHNAAAERVLGLTSAQLRAYKSPPGTVVDVDGREFPLEERPVRRAFETGEVQRDIVLGFGEPGSATRRWVSETVTPVRSADGAPERYILAARDVTALQQSELDHREYSRQLRSLHLIASMVTANGQEQIDAALALCRQELGLDWGYLGSIEGSEFVFTSSVGSNSRIDLYAVGTRFSLEGTLVSRAIAANDVLAISDLEALLAKDPFALARGHGAWKAYIAAPVRVSDGVYGAVGFVGEKVRAGGFSQAEQDFVRITATLIGSAVERSLQRERLDALAYCDALTGLANRLVFEDRLAQTVLSAKRYDERFAVLYLDLDGFKSVNDRFGHGAGDEVLKVVARRLEASVRDSDTVARIGGDEFLVLAPKLAKWSDASDLAWRLVRAMRVPIEINGVVHRVSASVGVSVFPEDGHEAETLVKTADSALYRAKLANKDSVSFAKSA